MQFERLRKSYKKQIIIGSLSVCVIGGALTFSLTRAKYNIAHDLELAKGTVNYKAYDFKIMAMYKSEDKTNYTEIEEMPSEGYTINESKSYCNMSNGNKDTNAILKTIDENHIISKLKKNDKCFIYFDKKTTASEIILANLGTSIKTETPDFSKVATTDEGIFATEDGMYGGTSYYWRGAATTNYVKFANFCWRILRINGDGTLRLIYDGSTCHNNGESTTDSIAVQNVVYNTASDRSEYVGWTYVEGKQRPEEGDTTIDSNVKIKTEEWYNNNIGNNTIYDSKLAIGKFCNNREVMEDNLWSSQGQDFFYLGRKVQINYAPTLLCDFKDVYNMKVGLLTASDIIYSGGKADNNLSYYLYNGNNYWGMTGYSWYGNGANYASGVYVTTNGYLSGGPVFTSNGIRPVINLRSDVTFSGGDGTLNNPYVVS